MNKEERREYKRVQVKAWRAKNKKHLSEYQKDRYHNHGVDIMQKAYRQRMKVERFFRYRANLFNVHYKTKFTEMDFKNLWDKQNGECPFTGWKLDTTAHIDHIIPIKRGGSHDITNLRWVCKEVNYGKRNMTDEEYLNVVYEIGKRLQSLDKGEDDCCICGKTKMDDSDFCKDCL